MSEARKPHSTRDLVEIIDHDLRKGGWVEQDGERWRVSEAGLIALQSLVEQAQAAEERALRLETEFSRIDGKTVASLNEANAHLLEQKEAADVLLRDCLDYIEHIEKHWGGGIAGSVDLKRRIRDSFPAKGPT